MSVRAVRGDLAPLRGAIAGMLNRGCRLRLNPRLMAWTPPGWKWAG